MLQLIGEIYQKFLEAHPALARGAKEQLALGLWEEILEERTRRHARPVRVKAGTLFVSTSSSVWAHELSLLKKEIMQKLNQRIGEETIRDIRFRVGERKGEING